MSARVLAFPPSERLPAGPCNLDAEQAVLGAALVTAALVRKCSFLSPDDFFEPVHGRIWATMRAALDAGRPADQVSLGPIFDVDPALADLGGRRYLSELAQSGCRILDAEGYANEVARIARQRRVSEVARELMEHAREPGAPSAAELVADAVPRLEAAGLDTARKAGRTLAEVASDIVDDLLNPPDTFSTGLPLLDASIGGAVPFGYVVGFEARPAGGKTMTLHTIALNAARGDKENKVPPVEVTYFAAEMGARRLTERMLGHLGGFKSQWFRHRDPGLASALGRVRGKIPGTLVLEDCPGVSFGRLRQMAAEHLRRRKCRLFILDYYQLVTPDGRTENKVQHLEEVANWLAKFAYDHGVTWLVASQQNRDGFTLAGDGLLRASDWLCQINRHERKAPHEKFGSVETVWLDVRKARDSAPDPVGSPEEPLLFIHPHGPHLAEIPQ
jgi:replicative DNA helicase